MPPRPLTYNATLVLQALSQGHVYGFEIMGATGLPSGTVYPVLRRLEAAGLVDSDWEDESRAHAEGRPSRRNYAPTPEGIAQLVEARERIATQSRLFGDSVAGPRQGS